MTEDLIQGTPEWIAARVGSLGASRVADAVARTKSGWGTSRANLMAEIIAERLTGVAAENYTNAAMQWGTAMEPEARAAYEFSEDVEVTTVGLVRHPRIQGTHASPDGLVGADGLVEIKCPNTANHIDTLLGDASIAGKYVTQMQWQMACTGRRWCDFVSYDPRLPEEHRLFVQRIPRDDRHIAELERDIISFLAEVEDKLARLQQRIAA